MFAFVALAWDEESVSARREAEEIRQRVLDGKHCDPCMFQAPGLTLFDLGSAPVANAIIPMETGLEGVPIGAGFGTMFKKSTNLKSHAPISRFYSNDTEKVQATQGTALISDYWGSYVALFRCGSSFNVVTDPTSAISCYYMNVGSVLVVFSHLEKCDFLYREHLTLNRRFISTLLAYDKVQNGETGFCEIRELLGGQRLSLDGGSSTVVQLWDPRTVALHYRTPSIEGAKELIRATTKYVVQCWATLFESITVSLSGGLDSTIVLSCLANAPSKPRIRAVHHRVSSEDPAEFEFAKLAAESEGCELLELQFGDSFQLPSVESHPLTVRPFRQFLTPDLESMFPDKASAAYSEPIFTGQGGDHLFHVRRSHKGFSDYIRIHGLNREAIDELMHSAKLSKRSLWEVIHLSLTEFLRRDKDSAMIKGIRKTKSPLNQLAHDQLDESYCIPEWTINANGVPPGKFDQVSTLIHLFQVRETMDTLEGRMTFHPLVSQPLIELCLQFPIHLLTYRGFARGLIREAFSGLIPEPIRVRMTKGETTRHFVDLVTRNRSHLINVLFHGELFKEGLLKTDSAELFVSHNELQANVLGHKLLVYYVIEAWLRRWKAFL